MVHQIAWRQALQGALVVGWKKEGGLATTSLELFEFHLQFLCGSTSTELSINLSANQCEPERAQMWTNIEQHVPRAMMSLLMSSPPISISHRLFRCRYSNSRDVIASSRSFSCPTARAPRRALLAGYTSNELMNPFPGWICWFLWCVMILILPDWFTNPDLDHPNGT